MQSSSGERFIDLFTPRTLPIFLMFFFWGFGTGGLWLVRPLFAYELSESFLLVALVSSISAAPRTIASPITGYLSDRFGRKFFVILGAVIQIVALIGQFLSTAYLPYFFLEMLGGAGIATWMTSSNALMADNTEVTTRGRTVALRQMSSRAGMLIGPMVAGLIAFSVELRAVFLFIAACKVAVIVVTLFWIHESTRTARPSPKPARGSGIMRRVDMTMFRSRAFLALAIGTFAVSLVSGGTGVFRTFFPVQGANAAGLDEARVGTLIALSGVLALAAAIPAGISNDRIGRKRTLIFALVVTSGAVWMMSGMSGFETALLAVLVFGLAEAFCTGTTQVYAMDLAPDDRRGAFLGFWSLSQNGGQIVGPLVIGTVADSAGFETAFIAVAGFLLVAALMVVVFGVETRRARQQPNARPP
ncbi:MAG: MFS transporter [Chloroflexi bacterium]|nr:MFS transporter [Chloroflexota bacterium]